MGARRGLRRGSVGGGVDLRKGEGGVTLLGRASESDRGGGTGPPEKESGGGLKETKKGSVVGCREAWVNLLHKKVLLY